MIAEIYIYLFFLEVMLRMEGINNNSSQGQNIYQK